MFGSSHDPGPLIASLYVLWPCLTRCTIFRPFTKIGYSRCGCLSSSAATSSTLLGNALWPSDTVLSLRDSVFASASPGDMMYCDPPSSPGLSVMSSPPRESTRLCRRRGVACTDDGACATARGSKTSSPRASRSAGDVASSDLPPCAFASGDVARACASGFEFSNTAETCHDFVTREISREASRAHPSRSADSTPRSPNDLLRWMLNPVERQRRGWESVGRRRARSRGASREKCVHPRLTQTGGEIRVRATTRPARDGAPCRARSSLESGCDRSKARRRRRAPGVRPGVCRDGELFASAS
eukprot:30937-Pelagococcus_subviridis.AAC.3